jgi:predicted DNA-binding antitoxin AbrB/MazE fold protein
MMIYPPVRAIYRDGTLRLLDPLELPEGAQVRLQVLPAPSDMTDKAHTATFVYPTRLVPAERLDNLTNLVAIGGDALADSEALYDPDWP